MSRKQKLIENTGARAFIPPWLSDPSLIAPCMCGEPLEEDQPHMIAESQFGLKRWWHIPCWHYFMQPSYADDDD